MLAFFVSAMPGIFKLKRTYINKNEHYVVDMC